jgi:hypothetical protein
MASSPVACDLTSISSSLNVSAASSIRASASVTGRRENRCAALMISAILFSIAARSSGVNGLDGKKS